MNSVKTTAILISLLLLGACAGGSYKGGRSGEVQSPGKTLHLYRMDIDHKAVKEGARLLFREPPPRAEQGFQRRAQGVFSVSDAGYCRIEVGCAEPVLSYDGRRGEQVYTLLKFFGRVKEDGTGATRSAGETTGIRSVRSCDEVRFKERGEGRITVQPWYNGKPGAYLFHFHRASIGRKDVRVPWR